MRVVIGVIVACLLAMAPPAAANGDMRQSVQDLFARHQAETDLARIKFEIDHLIDPSIGVEAQLATIDEMVATVKGMLPPNADSWQKVETIRRYIYEAGPWNDGRPFSYDFDDPFGKDIRNKIMADYLADRRGNCVTMPFLFIIIGQRLGLDVWPALAPLHVLVKFTDDQGNIYNLEATSGAGVARDSIYDQFGPITEQALANGVYLKPLNHRETLAVMAATVLEALFAEGRYAEAIELADVIIAQHPQYAFALVKKGAAYFHLLRTEFIEKYPNMSAVPPHLRARHHHLSAMNAAYFREAEALGWREPSQ
jgi:regulator of sirC expression with transglutaminase-like and TPR domain